MSANIMKRKNGAYNVPSTFGGLVDQLFANSLDRFFGDESMPGTMDWSRSVPVNIRETDKTFELSLVAPGLKKEDLDRIFNRFYRTDTSRQRDGAFRGGSGLGLAIARSIVQAHGGQIFAESQEGNGLKIIIALPRKS